MFIAVSLAREREGEKRETVVTCLLVLTKPAEHGSKGLKRRSGLSLLAGKAPTGAATKIDEFFPRARMHQDGDVF